MKTRTFVSILILVLAVMIITGSGVPKKTTLPTDNIDELVGTWANPENNKLKTGHHFGKMVYKLDKTADLYRNADSEKPGHPMSLDVKEKWMDREGSYYYRAILNHPYGQSYGLFKVSSDGNTLEMMFVFYAPGKSLEELPSEIDPTAGFFDSPSYFIWYRQ